MISYVHFGALLICVQQIMAADTNHYCYTGSSIYETEIQNCPSKNSSYTGQWYCGTMRICESFMSPARECVITRGCATEDQCQFNVDSDGALLDQPAGMYIYPSCCAAKDFPDDDTIAVDYSQICNPAAISYNVHSLVLTVGVATAVALCSAVL